MSSQLSNTQVGICTSCMTAHVTDEDFESNRICEECGKAEVYSVEELVDMANSYKDFLTKDDGTRYPLSGAFPQDPWYFYA